MEEKIITFQTFDNPALAHIVRTKLKSADIPCFLADEHIIGLNPLYNTAMGGVKLKIFERDYTKCVELLSADESIDSDENTSEDLTQVTCPHCNSSDVAYGNATKKRFGLLTMLVSFALLVYPFHNRKAWHCYNCDEEFQ